MIVDRYPPMNLFALVPDLAGGFDPVLRELDRLLEDEAILRDVKADLARRSRRSLTAGRPSTPVEVIVRLLVVKRLFGWSYEQVERFVDASLVLRQFCRIYQEKVPDDTTLLRWAAMIAPATLAALNERIVALARVHKVARGFKLRLDSTVVETTIHHPSDSSLLADSVRVLGRLVRRAKAILGTTAELGKAAFRTRTRSARRLVQRLHRLGRRKGADAAQAMRSAYGQLIAVTEATRRHAARVGAALCGRAGSTARKLARHIETMLPRVAGVLDQATRRVLHGEAVPASEKIVSLFEPHTQIIVRHKAGKPVEFGRKLWLEEVDGGIISGWRLLATPGQDTPYLLPSLEAHRARFGRPPRLVAADRGVFSRQNVAQAQQAGVRHVVIPATGQASPEQRRVERQRWFRRGFRFRAGIEGRISVLQRCYGLDRCPDHGEAGLARWIGWGIITANLERIARTLAGRAAVQAVKAA
ncbi:MAG: ISNCY family transposase [Geminicoccaceae bacterium]